MKWRHRFGCDRHGSKVGPRVTRRVHVSAVVTEVTMFQTRTGAVAVGVALATASMLTVGATAQAQTTPAAQVTFTKDVAPILQRSCQTCHRPGTMAPMSLLTYQDARPWARSMKAKVTTREMPPWFIDRNIGIQKFKNDPSLSDKEIETIAK